MKFAKGYDDSAAYRKFIACRMISWAWKPFAKLSNAELYAIMKARQEVFIIEQQCIYLDLDNADQNGWHLLGTESDGDLVAYLRVLPPTEQRPEPAIGRVLIVSTRRGHGLGRTLLAEGMQRTQEQFPGQDILLSAQHHLEPLYQDLGFYRVSSPYLEDGIPHVDMRWSA